MKPRRLVHRPVEAEAVKVESPYADVSSFVHRSHLVKGQHGRLIHVHLVDCPDKAKPGDWILKDWVGNISVLSEAELGELWDER